MPVPSDPDALRQIAIATGGAFANATSAEALRATYKDLGFAIGHVIERRENSAFYVAVALVALLMAAAAAMVWNARML